MRFVDSEDELIQIEKEAKKLVSKAKRDAWNAFLAPIKEQRNKLIQILDTVAPKSNNKAFNYADIVKNSVQRPSKILEETKKEEAAQSKRKTNVIISGLKTDASVQDDKIFKEICECLKQPMN